MIKIICDSTSSITREFANKHGIEMIPLSIVINENKIHTEGFAYENQKIFEVCDIAHNYYKTSQPTAMEFGAAFKKVIDNGDEAICLVISSNLSGTINSATVAKKEVDANDKITILDSFNAGSVLLLYIEEMVRLIGEGKSRKEIVEYIDSIKQTSYMQFVPDSLEHLKRGGRIGKLNMILGEILKIKPLITFRRNTLTCAKKVLGMTKAIAEIVALIPENAIKILVAEVHNSPHINKLFEAVSNKFKHLVIGRSDISPVVGLHVGPAVGVAVLVPA